MHEDCNVVIIGAGPAGASCALALRNSGLKVALVDKSKFPRDKTCGDAIPGPSLKFLKEIIEESISEFDAFELKQRIHTSILYLSNGASISINWKSKAYNSSRFSFDNFLLDLVKKYATTTIHEGVFVKEISKSNGKIHLKARDTSFSMSCDILVGSDGANSIVAKALNPAIPHKATEGVAIRAYYENVNCNSDSNEFYLLKGFKGYFWIFPMCDNLYNVGIGTFKVDLKKGFDLKKYLYEIIKDHPIISPKFKNAKVKSKVVGFALPSGGKKMKMSGERFILTGDAAHLIDPLQGHGIDKAMKSGVLAAQQIESCFKQNDFSETFIARYDSAVNTTIGKQLVRNFRLMQLFKRHPWLLRIFHPILKNNVDRVLRIIY
jgi:geranylgeranyl reductase family protein